jgi:hypothetical protein
MLIDEFGKAVRGVGWHLLMPCRSSQHLSPSASRPSLRMSRYLSSRIGTRGCSVACYRPCCAEEPASGMRGLKHVVENR